MKRNPYYWKTDKDGNQLPYIDEIKFKRVAEVSQYVIEAIAGNVDMAGFSMNDYTMLKVNETKGDYNLKLYQGTGWAGTALQLNQAVKDEKLREVFSDIRFREALSIAVDRRLISEIVTSGIAEHPSINTTEIKKRVIELLPQGIHDLRLYIYSVLDGLKSDNGIDNTVYATLVRIYICIFNYYSRLNEEHHIDVYIHIKRLLSSNSYTERNR